MKTIAWDIDDVLNDFMRDWFEKSYLAENPKSLVSYFDLKENPPNSLLGMTIDDYRSSLDKYRSTRFLSDTKPVPIVMQWFQQYGSRFRHIALTAVPLNSTPYSSFWLFRYFGQWIRTFHFVPSKRRNEDIPLYDRDKGEYLAMRENVDVLIDDNEDNINSAKDKGIQCILMPRPWNKENKSIEDVLASLLSING